MTSPSDSTCRNRPRVAWATAVTWLAFLALNAWSVAFAQGNGRQPEPRQLTIPYLANATKPDDLDFAAAQCDVAAGGEQMTCRFRQVFLTVSSIDATSCVMTTNGYAQTFRRQSPTRWEAAEAPAGECGIVETTTLDDGGGVHWTMTVRRVATREAGQLECVAAAAESRRYSWKDVKRTLPCTSIQPGAIER